MYDVIVVGARCAGAATAMLLARRGYEVLLVDRATFPSEIPHGHFIHRQGPQRLARWGLLDRIEASGCPAVTSSLMDLGDFPLTADDLRVDGVALGYGPRRSVLDKLLIDAAVEAGAHLREGFGVDDFTTEDGRLTGIRGRSAPGGRTVTESATLVVGADGRRSRLARFVGAPEYQATPPLTCWYFSYWSGAADRGVEIYLRRHQAVFAFPTHDSLLAVFVGWPVDRFAEVRADIDGHFMAAVDELPGLAERVRSGRREEPFRGASDLPNFFRRPHGPGWALVGDAGCHKDPILALGMCDALRDSELLVEAVDDALDGDGCLEESLLEYEGKRNALAARDYQENLQAARFEPPPDHVYQLRAALRDQPEEARRFFLARQGMIPPETFFNPGHLQALLKDGARLLCCLLLLILLPLQAWSQSRLTGADLTGRVRDESGAVLPGAIRAFSGAC
jgi:flavin-dependent dehydrogenase